MIALAAAGCNSNDPVVNPPPVIIAGRTVPPIIKTVVVPAEIPAELLRDCYDEPARELSAAEAKRLAELRRKSIADCNAVKAKYRGGK